MSVSPAGIYFWEVMEELARFKPEYQRHWTGIGWCSSSANWEKFKTTFDQEMI